MTFYDLLGVPRTIPISKDLEKSYQKRLKQLKQEKLSKTDYEEMKKQLQLAYKTLSDYHRRHEYDNHIDSIFPFMHHSFHFPLDKKADQYYSKQAMQIMNMSPDGEKTVYETTRQDENGKIEQQMKKTKIDKNGQKTELPFTEKEKTMLKNNKITSLSKQLMIGNSPFS